MALSPAARIMHKYTGWALNPRPEYYKNRGNTAQDINSDILEQAHQGFAKEIGSSAAESMVEAVKRLTELGDVSAATFLRTIYKLEDNHWVYDDDLITVNPAIASSRAMHQDMDNAKAYFAMGLDLSAAFNARDKSHEFSVYAITGGFLRNHGIGLHWNIKNQTMTLSRAL